ncbi:MAG: hypothetical protein ACHQDC_01715 [Acidimicrobiales bacterium]
MAGNGRKVMSVVAVVVVMSVFTAACANKAAYESVSGGEGIKGAALQTSTTLNGKASSSSAKKSTKSTKSSAADLATTARQLIEKIVKDPAFLSQIVGGNPALLAALTGVDEATLAKYNITPETIKSLAGLILGLDSSTISTLAGAGSGDTPPTALLGALFGLAGEINPVSAAQLKNADTYAIAALLGTAAGIDPSLLDAMSGVLKVVDPNGLGALANDRNSLAIIAVLFGVALNMNPADISKAGLLNQLDPRVNSVLERIGFVVGGLSPMLVRRLNNLSDTLGPDLIRVLAGMLALVDNPNIAAVIKDQANNEITLATAIGTALLLIPGLAETLNPTLFAQDPTIRYRALLELVILGAINTSGLPVRDIAARFGIVIPDNLF